VTGRAIISSLYKPRVIHDGEQTEITAIPTLDDMLQKVQAARRERQAQQSETKNNEPAYQDGVPSVAL